MLLAHALSIGLKLTFLYLETAHLLRGALVSSGPEYVPCTIPSMACPAESTVVVDDDALLWGQELHKDS